MPRSFLYVPANREKFLEKAIGLPSDAFIFDLEDSVPAAEKANARAGVRAYAPKIAGNRVWVRVNGLDTGLAEADLDAVIGVDRDRRRFPAQGRVRDEVVRWDAMIGALEARAGMTAGAMRLVLSIESARGVLNAYDMAVGGKARGLAHLRRRAGRRPQHRSRLRLVDRRSGNDACALATRCCPRAPRASTRRSTACSPTCATPKASSATPRCRAGSAIADASSSIPSQIEPCNRLYAPSQPELDYYARVLEAFDKAVAQGSASTTVDGR